MFHLCVHDMCECVLENVCGCLSMCMDGRSVCVLGLVNFFVLMLVLNFFPLCHLLNRLRCTG